MTKFSRLLAACLLLLLISPVLAGTDAWWDKYDNESHVYSYGDTPKSDGTSTVYIYGILTPGYGWSLYNPASACADLRDLDNKLISTAATTPDGTGGYYLELKGYCLCQYAIWVRAYFINDDTKAITKVEGLLKITTGPVPPKGP